MVAAEDRGLEVIESLLKEKAARLSADYIFGVTFTHKSYELIVAYDDAYRTKR